MARRIILTVLMALTIIALVSPSAARNPYRRAFFDVYTSAEGSRLDNLPSNAGHCGICHFDFDGSGPRNPYGLDVEVALASGDYPNNEAAIESVENEDSDNDGFSNWVEITDTTNFANTPTFPGLKASNVGSVVNVDTADILAYLTPSGGTDTTPPDVLVTSPNGGEVYAATTVQTINWTASDASGISHVDILLSDDGSDDFKFVAKGLPDTGSYSWFVPNLPGSSSRIRVVAYDVASNDNSDDSDAQFTIDPVNYGVVPTTLRDFEMAGTQPFESGILEDPSENCVTCHGGYDLDVEPWHNWRGSMMGQAMRDPLFLATMVVAEQDAPASGDLCLRCHTPGGWQEGRSTDTTGGMLTPKDRQSIQCDFCHRQVDIHYQAGISPPEDVPILDDLDEIPLNYANGQFVTDPDPIRRGPYADAEASHQFLESPLHRSANICGTCHDVSNPVFVQGSNPAEYVAHDLDAPHPDGDLRNMFPVERTFSEWTQSEYAATGVFAPQFAGDKPDGIVSTCQDCHMRDVTGKGADSGPNRADLPLHDMMGGNHFVGDILPSFYPDEVDVTQLQDAKQRALGMLSLAASMQLSNVFVSGQHHVSVILTNETGHKLPSGYPEGRRMWLNVKAYDTGMNLVYESGAYDLATGELTHDGDVKIYEVKPGISTRLAGALGLVAGPSFHFVLNDSIYFDNRIPPRGFTNAAFEAIQSPPVDYTYEDGAYQDLTSYTVPGTATLAEVTLYYQTTSKEYIEFLRDANETNDLGQQLYDAWVAQGRAAPVAMVSQQIELNATTGAPDDGELPRITSLGQNFPNPFNPVTKIGYSLAQAGPVSLRIFDERGRLVRTLVQAVIPAGEHEVAWTATDDDGRRVASGVYYYVLKTAQDELRRKMTVIK